VTFSLWIGLGAALGLCWMALQSPTAPWRKGRAAGIPSERGWYAHLDAGLWALLGGVVGGRAVYAAAAWPYFAAHPLEIPQVWLGGLSGPGAAAGAVLGAGLFAARRRLPAGALASALLPLGADAD
jgi:prolipoprotein diacylglyceryltransferase